MSPALIVTFIAIFVILLACYRPVGSDDNQVVVAAQMVWGCAIMIVLIALFATIAISAYVAFKDPKSGAWMVFVGAIAAVFIITAILERQQQI